MFIMYATIVVSFYLYLSFNFTLANYCVLLLFLGWIDIIIMGCKNNGFYKKKSLFVHRLTFNLVKVMRQFLTTLNSHKLTILKSDSVFYSNIVFYDSSWRMIVMGY